jgi:hypothetical protein
VPDDVGGRPFPDGEDPEYRDHGAADDEFASVVFDEDFVRAAEVHEPSAAERILASAQSHAEKESENPRSPEESFGYARGESDFPLDEFADADDPFDEDPDDDEGRFDRSDYYRGDGFRADDEGWDVFPSEFRSEFHPDIPPELDPAFEHGADYGYAQGAYGRSARGVYGRYGPSHGASHPYRSHRNWQRPVAWVLAVVMGIGMVALAFSAVYRGAAGQRQEPAPPPATTGVGTGAPGTPPTAPAQPPGG